MTMAGWMRRILLNPDGVEGGAVAPPSLPSWATGNTPPPVAATPPQVGAAPPASAPPPGPLTLTLTPQEYEAYLAKGRKLAELERTQQEQELRAQQERIRLMAEKGEFEKALKETEGKFGEKLTDAEKRYQALESRYLERERSLAISEATAGVEFASPAAATQARQLLELRFEAVRGTDESITVVDRATRRPAKDVAAEWLKTPDAAHFLKPKGGAGAGATGGERPGEADGQPKDLKTRLALALKQKYGENPNAF
jgi:hypothetical protein